MSRFWENTWSFPQSTGRFLRGYFVNVFGGTIANEDEAIDLEVEAYRKELEDERRFSTSGVSPDTADVKKKVG